TGGPGAGRYFAALLERGSAIASVPAQRDDERRDPDAGDGRAVRIGTWNARLAGRACTRLYRTQPLGVRLDRGIDGQCAADQPPPARPADARSFRPLDLQPLVEPPAGTGRRRLARSAPGGSLDRADRLRQRVRGCCALHAGLQAPLLGDPGPMAAELTV